VKTGAGATPETIDDYLAKLDVAERTALEKLRKDIHAAAPGAEECISYRIPAFRLNGKVLFWFAAQAKHCAFYPGAVVQTQKALLKGYDTAKGTVRFQAARPLPALLVRKLVKAQIARHRVTSKP
jgi:uncharacterized protein YdhG (YjbR/CyaY superfamily)